MSAQSWSVKGIDPKIREAAREAAARQGMTLAEYLNHALAHQAPNTPPSVPQSATTPRTRTARYLGAADLDESDEEWQVGGSLRGADPARLAQRIESIERRMQLAVTGLDRAVSTIDRSVMGLAARVDDAEAMSGEAAERISQALEQFRLAGDTLSGRLERAEQESVESRRALDGARERLEHQVAVAGEIARRAEAAASYLSAEMENRDADVAQTLEEARGVAEEAARQAASASADAVNELRLMREQMSERLAESESSTRRAIENAVAEVRNEAADETRGTREALLEEVVRLEGEIAKRVGNVEQLKSDHAALIARIERAEANAREATAGLRQAAGAAIADLRNAQLTLASRVKQVEDVAGASGAIDLTDLRHAQQDIAERLRALETKTESSPVADALAAFEARIADVETGGAAAKLGQVDTALQRLAERLAETESTANTAIRTLEETVSALGARVEQGAAAQESEAVRAMLEQRLDTMAQSVSQMVGEAREELAGQLQAAMGGVTGAAFEDALADVNRRLAGAERRQAQTIEAISLEIKRMSESVDKRLRAVEARNDDAAASAVREELTRMASTLEARFDDIERREAAAFDRMGIEVGRLSERLEERVGAVETRSAQAIEHVGEQVARMADRINQRHDTLARDLSERMIDSEDRSGARVAEAISSIMQRLAEVEERSAEAIAPVQKAVTNVASKLQQYESANAPPETEAEPLLAIPTPTRRVTDFESFGSDDLSDPTPQPYPSPMDMAQPVRAAPLAPRQTASDEDDDIYFTEDASDLLIEEEPKSEAAPQYAAPAFEPEQDRLDDDDLLVDDIALEPSEPLAPLQDEEPFWLPEDGGVQPEEPESLFGATPDDVPLASPAPEPPAPEDVPLANLDGPPAKLDYLAAARKAAQAQSPARTRAEPGPTPRLSLRGSSRIILWGAASAIAMLIAGGAWYLNNRDSAQSSAGAQTPETQTAPADAEAAPSEAAPLDPGAATAAPAGATPIAEGDAALQPASAVVAGPLAPRAQSLQDAAQAGDLTAQYELSLQQIAAGRTQDGVTLLRRAADRGFPMAQYRLAKLYERGEGVPVDLVVARQWTERAAAAGNRRAMHDLGVYYARGEGAPLDEAAAFRWFRQAAELGVADSQYNLGVLYQQGRGVNASASEALFWFLVASRQGDQDAAARATALEPQLSQMQLQQARARAQSFRPRAAIAVANGEFGPRPWARGGA
jgi:localization factor PodJL